MTSFIGGGFVPNAISTNYYAMLRGGSFFYLSLLRVATMVPVLKGYGYLLLYLYG
jgi:hypothetical protein